MVYANKNEKAVAFGESEIRQLTGKLKLLREKYDEKLENGGPSVAGRIPSRFTGLSIEERRALKLDEIRIEGDELEAKLWHLTYHVNELKKFMAREEQYLEEWPEDFWAWNCKYQRRKIAEYTGTNPASFVEEG